MSVERMKKVNIFACRSDRKSILELIQSKGFIEVSTSQENEVFHFQDTSEQLRQFDQNLELLSAAINILDTASPEKKPFYFDSEEISKADLKAARKREGDILAKAARIKGLYEAAAWSKAEANNNRLQIAGLKIWESFDQTLNITQTKKTAIFTGSIQGDFGEEDLYEKFLRFTEVPIYIEIISRAKDQTCFYLIVHKNDEEAIKSALNEIGFVRAAMKSKGENPRQMIEKLTGQIDQLNNQTEICEKEIIHLCEKRRELQILFDSFYARRDKYQVINRLLQTNRVFILSGYMPAGSAEEFKELLEKQFVSCVELIEPQEDEEVPVKLKNNWFASPLESIVESFSLPSKTDIDPTFIMSIFYYFYFGMMFSDAGYGLMVMIACGLLGFAFKNVKPGLRTSMRMFFFCGISTFVWGLLYGSFFGNAVSVISNGFFHVNIELKPILFDPVKDPLRLLIISVAMGIVHILTAYVLKFITLWRAKKRGDAICDAGLWIFLLTGISLVAVWFGAGVEFMKLPALILVGIGAGGLILFAGRSNKNIILRLFAGIVSLYDLTGFLSDALSYSRLMALGLATGVIATVANLMGSLFGFGFPGGILFWIVFIAFHLINFAINMLGAYVHTNRLQYVEFFGKFYEGGGRKFEPFSRKYKYTKIKE